jgi:hypothetical protein
MHSCKFGLHKEKNLKHLSGGLLNNDESWRIFGPIQREPDT